MSAKHRRVFWPLVMTVVACAALAYVSARTKDETSTAAPRTDVHYAPSTVPNTAPPIGEATQMLVNPRGPVQNVCFTVYDVGIYPRQVRVQKGIIGISIADRTGSSPGLLIERENGNGRVPIGQVVRLVNQTRGRERFSLQPGRYRISNASLQTSEAELIVEP